MYRWESENAYMGILRGVCEGFIDVVWGIPNLDKKEECGIITIGQYCSYAEQYVSMYVYKEGYDMWLLLTTG